MVRFNKKGFTLIELLVVIAIIGILASLLMIGLSTARQKAKNARALSEFNQIALAMQLYYDKNNGHWPNEDASGFFEFIEDDPGWQENDKPAFVPEFYSKWDSSWYCSDCKMKILSYDISDDGVDKPDCGSISLDNSIPGPPGVGSTATKGVYKIFLCLTNQCTICGNINYYTDFIVD